MRRRRAVLRSTLVLATVIAALVTGVAASGQILDGPSESTTTTTPPAGGAPGSTTTTTPAKQPPVGGGGDSADVSGVKRVIPPGYSEIINSVKRSRANNTEKLLRSLQPLIDLGLTRTDAAVVGFGRFPVAGYTTFTDDWFNPRFTPTFHLHEGTDLFAAQGTPVRAPVDGVVRHSNGATGGLAVYVRTKEGHDVYMAHLASFSDVKPGDTVRVGDVVGFVGDTGNARGGAPHVHFEIHPRGRGPVNPKPYLDAWIAQALAAAPTVIAAYDTGRPRAVVATGLTRHLADGRAGSVLLPSGPPRAQLAWASAANPTGGALRLAQAEATAASSRVDWAARARIAAAQRQRARGRRRAGQDRRPPGDPASPSWRPRTEVTARSPGGGVSRGSC